MWFLKMEIKKGGILKRRINEKEGLNVPINTIGVTERR